MECKHKHFYADVRVARITDEGQDDNPDAEIKAYIADVQVKCNECGIEFQFVGIEGGFNWNYPTTNVDATKVNLPMIPSNRPRIIDKKVN